MQKMLEHCCSHVNFELPPFSIRLIPMIISTPLLPLVLHFQHQETSCSKSTESRRFLHGELGHELHSEAGDDAHGELGRKLEMDHGRGQFDLGNNVCDEQDTSTTTT